MNEMTPKQQREFDHSVKLIIHKRRKEKLFSLEDVAEAVSYVNREFGICRDSYLSEAEINGQIVDSVETRLMKKYIGCIIRDS